MNTDSDGCNAVTKPVAERAEGSRQNQILVAAASITVIVCGLIWGVAGIGLLTGNPSSAESQTGAALRAMTREVCADAGLARDDDPQQSRALDLCAQYIAASSSRDAAMYAQAQTWIGLVGFSFVIFGLWLNWVATNAATESNKLAREQFELQRRAWISVKATAVRIGPSRRLDATFQNDGTNRCEIVLRARNIGQSPALNVTFWVANGASLFWEAGEEAKLLQNAMNEARDQPHPVGGYVFPGEERSPRSFTVNTGSLVAAQPGGFFWAYGFATYQLRDGGESHFTPFAVSVVYWPSEDEDAAGGWQVHSEMHAINLAPD